MTDKKSATPKRTKKAVVKKTASKVRKSGPSAPVVGVDGKAKGSVSLSKELFDAKINKTLLSQAVRVYLANQRQGKASTKTRSEVKGSTRKVWRQKGTGRARHGSITGPIFVGGGITFGPKPRDYSLKFPKKMKRQALASALTQQLKDGNVLVVDGLSELEAKTKQFAQAHKTIVDSQKTLVVITDEDKNIRRGCKNIERVSTINARNMHVYATLMSRKVVFTKPALKVLEETFVPKAN